jgi:quercetin dioxygenase-like cupin family protein
VTSGELVVTIVRASAGVTDSIADEVVIRPGDSMFLPRGTVRSVENRTADAAVLLVILQPEVTRDE